MAATKDDSAAEVKKVSPKIVQAPDLVTFYATGARIVESEYDVRIYFSDQQIPPHSAESSSKPPAVEKICIVLAPRYAIELCKDFCELDASGALEDYFVQP